MAGEPEVCTGSASERTARLVAGARLRPVFVFEVEAEDREEKR
jgi:hypothetical protein